MNRVLQQALKILDMPEGPSHKELQAQARDYLSSLGDEEYRQLKAEALSEDRLNNHEDYLEKLQLLRSLAFTPTEVNAYAKMRITSPGVRRVIARRALLMCLLGRDKLPKGTTFYKIIKLQNWMLGDKSDDEVMEALENERRRAKKRSGQSRVKKTRVGL